MVKVKSAIIIRGKDIGRKAHLINVGGSWKIITEKGEHRMSAEKTKHYKTEKTARRQFKDLTDT